MTKSKQVALFTVSDSSLRSDADLKPVWIDLAENGAISDPSKPTNTLVLVDLSKIRDSSHLVAISSQDGWDLENPERLELSERMKLLLPASLVSREQESRRVACLVLSLACLNGETTIGLFGPDQNLSLIHI